MEHTEILKERYALVMDRIREIPEEKLGDERLEAYFCFCAEFLIMIADTMDFLAGGGLEKAPVEELAQRNRMLYGDILPEHYGESYGNPSFAVKELGRELGRLLCFLYTELRSLIGFAYENRLEDIVIRMEVFAEVYGAFCHAAGENEGMPSGESVREILYWFISDYSDIAAERRLRECLCPEKCFAADIIMKSNLTDLRYLYACGEYAGRNEIERALCLAGLSGEAVRAMADHFTEEFRTGYAAAGKELTGKKTIGLCYPLGYERVMRLVIENFAAMGLKTVVFRAPSSVLEQMGTDKEGFCGGIPNRQFVYDHKDDQALFLDRNFVNRRLEVARTAYEEFRQQAGEFAGIAVMRTPGGKEVEAGAGEDISGEHVFGENVSGQNAFEENILQLYGEQSRLWAEYVSRMTELRRAYTDEMTVFVK